MKNSSFLSHYLLVIIFIVSFVFSCGNVAEDVLQNITDEAKKNLCPIATPDTYTVVSGGTLTVTFSNGILSNDADPGGGAMSASIIITPKNGTLSLNADGSFTYVHDGSGTGEDKFLYVASNSTCDNTFEPEFSSMAEVIITITGALPSTTTENIYVTGAYWNSVDDHAACYWTDKDHDGVWETNLIPNSCGVYDIAVHNGNVYVVGDDNNERATIWKNGNATVLKTPTDGKSWSWSFATGIAIDGNDIYVSGNYIWSEDDWLRACYWKNGQFQALNKSGEANAIAVKDGVPITVGHYYQNGKKAIKWTGTTKKILHSQGEGEAWDIVVDEFNTTHISGNAANDNNKTNWFAAYWKDDNPTEFLPRGNHFKNLTGKDANGGDGEGITTDNGIVYIGGNTKYSNMSSFSTQGWWPSYWKGKLIVEPILQSNGSTISCNINNYSCEYGKI